MSTLPFLLSVADELDNLNSQNYLDDFGLGFHPHRQYYRTPSIQLSLPAGTDWMEERQRCRTHKFIDETQNNFEEEIEGDEDDEVAENNGRRDYNERRGDNGSSSTSSRHERQQYTSALNSNINIDDDNVDNAVQMYKLSKKCCKNYHRHGTGTTKSCSGSGNKVSGDGFRLHARCIEANNSSSDESLQKVPSSSIEFLTCFLVKKSRISKSAASERKDAGGKKS